MPRLSLALLGCACIEVMLVCYGFGLCASVELGLVGQLIIRISFGYMESKFRM